MFVVNYYLKTLYLYVEIRVMLVIFKKMVIYFRKILAKHSQNLPTYLPNQL